MENIQRKYNDDGGGGDNNNNLKHIYNWKH
jgi:hypothetical protein